MATSRASKAQRGRSTLNDPRGLPSKPVREDAERVDEEQPDGPSDAQLVRRAQGEDREAFALLFDRYHRRAYAVALGTLKNPDDAYDVVQDAFIKVHRHLKNFKGTSSFYTWLYRIVMNLCIDHIRKKKRHGATQFDEGASSEDLDVLGGGELMPTMLDGNPGKGVFRRELSEAINAALEELPEHHRAVILLREIEGLSYEEMAETLKVPKGTIMSRLFHARKKLQGMLEIYMTGEITVEDDDMTEAGGNA